MNKELALEELKKEIINAKLLLHQTATNVVMGRGNINANILIIGEAPGEQEDLCGKSFVGKAGKLLDKELLKIGLKENNIYIANILKYRPPKNRNPSTEEMVQHTPYLIKQIEIMKPSIIITLGNFSTKFLKSEFIIEKMNKIESISEIHGIPESNKEYNYIIFPMYHPAATMYNPKIKKDFENDFEKLKQFLIKMGYNYN